MILKNPPKLTLLATALALTQAADNFFSNQSMPNMTQQNTTESNHHGLTESQGLAIFICCVVYVLASSFISYCYRKRHFDDSSISGFALHAILAPLILIDFLFGFDGKFLEFTSFMLAIMLYIATFPISCPIHYYFYPEEVKNLATLFGKGLSNLFLLPCVLLSACFKGCAESEGYVGMLTCFVLIFQPRNNSSQTSSALTEPLEKFPLDPEVGSTQDNPIVAYAVNPTMSLAFQTIAENELEISPQALGQGAFGVVYKGTWKMTEVAVKQMYVPSRLLSEMVKNELEVHGKLRHTNIVSLFGVCYAKTNVNLVLEYMPNKSLDIVLKKTKLTWPVRFKIAKDIASGVNFLHTSNPKIIHRDLKSMNILLDKQMCAKLSDFGLAQFKNVTSSTIKPSATSTIVGTYKWMAPELFSMGAKYTELSDMYAFGMVLWEISSQKEPFQDMENANRDNVEAWAQNGKRQDIPSDTPKKLAQLITQCWAVRAAERPKALYVAQELETLCSAENTGSNVQWSHGY